MKNVKYLMLALAAGVILASCCPCRKQKARDAQAIRGVEWKMTQFNGRSFTAEKGYTLLLGADGKVSGMGDCNRLTGTYTLDDTGVLKFGMLASTRMMCANQAQEDSYMKTLQAVDAWQMDGPLLMLFKQGELVAAFEKK